MLAALDVAKPSPPSEPLAVEARTSAPLVRLYGLFGQGFLVSLPRSSG